MGIWRVYMEVRRECVGIGWFFFFSMLFMWLGLILSVIIY